MTFSIENLSEKNFSRRDALVFGSLTLFTLGTGRMIFELFNYVDGGQRDIYLSFLKFRAAQVYAKTKKWPLVEQTVGHFINGMGQDLDITNTALESLRIEGLKNGEQLPDDTLLINMFSEIASRYFNQNNQVEGKTNNSQLEFKNDLLFRLSNQKTFPFSFSGGTKMHIEDFRYSLNNFGVNARGNISNIKRGEGKWKLGFMGEYQIFDTYDWKNQDEILKGTKHSNTAVELFLRELGVKDPEMYLSAKVGQKTAEEILANKIGQFCAEDGYRLQSSGMGKVYDIYTRKYCLNSPAEITVPDTFFN